MAQPTPPDADQLTALLEAASGGNAEALNRAFPLVYDALRGLARSQLRSERPGHTLSTTALVHEAYLKLVGQRDVQWRGRAHFYAIASQAMRRILLNHARGRRAAKRGGDPVPIRLEQAGLRVPDERLDDLLALDEAIERLQAFNPRGADVVVYRFFGGLSYEEIADAMDTSVVTVRRAWTAARTWLHRELSQAMP